MNRLLRLSALSTLALMAACSQGEPQQEPATDATVAPAPAPVAAAPTSEAAAPAAPAPAAAGGMIDPNTATREQLLTVPGMDAATADALVQGRPYADMLAVDKVLATSMDAAKRKATYATLWKKIDLNRASKEEMLLIPGVGNKMQHEFEEYRPYRNVEQFRREIGKYVDDDEVARFERYVEIR